MVEERFKPAIAAVTSEVVEARAELITRDLGKLMQVVAVHLQREQDMAAYLRGVAAHAVGGGRGSRRLLPLHAARRRAHARGHNT